MSESEKVLQLNTNDIAEKGQKIYEEILREKLEPEHKGEIVAIDPDGREYFFGESIIEAVEKGREKYPGKVFYVVRVGYPAVDVFR